MTREEALSNVKGYLTDLFPSEEYDEVEEIMKALEQEPCESDEVKKIDEWKIQEKTAELWIVKGNLQIRYLGTIHNTPLPSVTPQQKMGYWLHLTLTPDDLTGHVHGECSVCGKVRIVDNYCPNCGTKMFKPQEDQSDMDVNNEGVSRKSTNDGSKPDVEK